MKSHRDVSTWRTVSGLDFSFVPQISSKSPASPLSNHAQSPQVPGEAGSALEPLEETFRAGRDLIQSRLPIKQRKK